MAKAKKSELAKAEKTSAAKTTKKEATAKPAAAKAESKSAAAAKATTKAASKKSAPAAGGSPLVDTSAAAVVAAALVGNRATIATPATSDAPKAQSAAFKQLKEGLNKPSAGNLGGLFGNVGNQKKSNLPFAGGNQRGHSQRFGADVNRSGVPRRTGG